MNLKLLILLLSCFVQLCPCLCQMNFGFGLMNFNNHRSKVDRDSFKKVECGSMSTKEARFTLINPEHPDSTYGKLICETVVEHSNPKVTKLSLKLRKLQLYRPTMDGDCLQDKFAVFTDLNRAVTPVICGNRTGDTIVVPFQESQKNLIVSIMTSDLDHDRYWIIDVEQQA